MSARAAAAEPRLARVVLRKNLARALRGGHPWIFRDALAAGPPLGDGALVAVTDGRGAQLGIGFWTATTPLAVRMLTSAAADQNAAPADVPALIVDRLRRALARRLAAFDLRHTNAFRWVHGEADLLPGVHLDVYDGYGTVRFDGPGARAFYRDLPRLLGAAAPAAPGSFRLRALCERAARGRDGEGGRVAPLLGTLPAGEIEVVENGLRFGVDLAHGQKGGLFLDQRDNRARVRGLASGRRVLNLFGYTGGFSIYAAAGGARATTTVDLSGAALAAARRNFERNGLGLADAELVVEDAFAFLKRARGEGRRWDLVISDPPSFAPSRRAVPEALRAYARLHALAGAVVEPGGLLCAASCSSHVAESAFIGTVTEGCARAGRVFHRRESHGAAADHPALAGFPEGDYLKFVVGEAKPAHRS